MVCGARFALASCAEHPAAKGKKIALNKKKATGCEEKQNGIFTSKAKVVLVPGCRLFRQETQTRLTACAVAKKVFREF